MNRFASRHRDALRAVLEPDETLLAGERVVLTAAIADETARGDRGNRAKRVEAARALGFAIPGPIFVVAVTDRRLLLLSSSAWLGHPRELRMAVPIDDIAAIRAVRRLLAQRLAIVLENRSMLVVQPLWARGLHHLERAFTAVKGA